VRLLCPGARSVAWPSTPSDLCLQRLDATSTDCVEKRDPRQDATNKYCQLKELDFNARLEKQSLDHIRRTAAYDLIADISLSRIGWPKADMRPLLARNADPVPA
jgi:hypothetical protein